MFAYHIRLALKSLRRNPALTGLMIGAIALGVGICITMLTVYRLMSGNPIAHRNDVLYAVTLDSYDPNEPYDVERPELAPPQLTYRDAMALLESDIPARQAVMRRGSFVAEPEETADVPPTLLEGRLTTKDFFAMFDVPFLHGGAWDRRADDAAQRVVVLSRETNAKFFGGANSVGKELRLSGHDYTVIGVLDDWNPAPKFYDVNNGAFNDSEDLFVPFSVGIELELASAGNTNCWRPLPLDSFRGFLASECLWLQFWVELHGERVEEQVEKYGTFLDNYVREQKKQGRFERPLNNRLYTPAQWLEVNEVVRDDNRVLVGLSFMFLAVCLLNTIGLLLAKFLGTAPLVGLRRALGASRATIFRQHLVETGVIGTAGGVLGILVAWLGLMGVRQLYDSYDELTRLDLTMGLVALAIAILSGILAGLYPTWRICRVEPARYLKTQ